MEKRALENRELLHMHLLQLIKNEKSTIICAAYDSSVLTVLQLKQIMSNIHN